MIPPTGDERSYGSTWPPGCSGYREKIHRRQARGDPTTRFSYLSIVQTIGHQLQLSGGSEIAAPSFQASAKPVAATTMEAFRTVVSSPLLSLHKH